MLTGQIKSFDDIPDTDFRKMLPRFQPENFEANMKLVKEVEKIAATTVERVKENGVVVELSEEMKDIDETLASFEVAGDRYHAFGMKLING
jgi:pyridoxine 4-dehydrogenase